MSFQSLIQEAIALENDYYDEGDDIWDGSPFAWIRDYKPATVGAVGRRLARHIFQQANVPIVGTGRLLSAGRYNVAVKFSMEWTAGGFVFEQIKDAQYDFLFCLGVRAPDNCFCWLIPKIELIVGGTWQTREGLTGQHTGAAGQETAWLQINPDNRPAWLAEYGGTVDRCEQVITRTLA